MTRQKGAGHAGLVEIALVALIVVVILLVVGAIH